MKFIILSLFVVGALGDPNTKIAGGTYADIIEFPFQISLQTIFDDDYEHFCSGTILNERWVLTAGHCILVLTVDEKGYLVIVAGITRLSDESEAQIIPVIKTIVHPGYTSPVPAPDDIALVKLKTALVFTSKVKPAKLPAAGSIATGYAWLSGWGSIVYIVNPIVQYYPDRLRKAKYAILDTGVCKSTWGLIGGNVDSNANMCTQGVLSSSCNGDSGGPLSIGEYIVGIVSWGLIFCGLGPSVFTRVSNYNDFIVFYINDLQ